MSEREPPPGVDFRLHWPESPAVPGRPSVPAEEDVQLVWAPDPASEEHRACREEIERLQALVEELRAEMKTLRRKAQLRSSR